jgi:hypothetical protein
MHPAFCGPGAWRSDSPTREDTMSESICIEDFCGSWHGMPVSFSADYFPTESLCYFTGDWDSSTEIPPMPSASVPTEADVYVWARKHGSGW